MSIEQTKAPRLYGDYDLSVGGTVTLTDDHNHYLLNVMRKSDGDYVRLFNGRDGEFIGTITKTTKKAAKITVTDRLRPQDDATRQVHLYFAPIKKDRLAMLIEKSIELGVTDFHPVITAHTENRYLKDGKIRKQMIEAAEQCERLDMPQWHNTIDIRGLPDSMPVYAALERSDAPPFTPTQVSAADPIAILIGPEGGWSAQERIFLNKHKTVIPVTLGPRILRAETAAFFMLSRIG